MDLKKTILPTLRYQLAQLTKVPTALTINLVDRCSLKCQMCDIWQNKGKDMPLADWHKALTQPLLRKITYIGLTGGEPLLYKELPQFATMVCGLYNLETLHLNTSGIYPDRLQKYLEIVSNIHGPRFVVAISLDGIESHNRIRGVEVYDKALISLGMIRACNIEATINCVVTDQKPNELDRLVNLAKTYNLPLNITPAYSRTDLNHDKEFVLAEETAKWVEDYLYKQQAKTKALPIGYILQMRTGKRQLPCAFLDGAAVSLDANGELYVCQNEFGAEHTASLAERRKKLKQTKCETCLSTCFNSLAMRGHIMKPLET